MPARDEGRGCLCAAPASFEGEDKPITPRAQSILCHLPGSPTTADLQGPFMGNKSWVARCQSGWSCSTDIDVNKENQRKERAGGTRALGRGAGQRGMEARPRGREQQSGALLTWSCHSWQRLPSGPSVHSHTQEGKHGKRCLDF